MAKLKSDNYGKTRVRLTQVIRNGDRHEVTEISVRIIFKGNFADSYTKADNSIVLPTDTIKNTVYIIARQNPIQSIEQFARDLAKNFLGRVKHLETVEIDIQQSPWSRIENHDSAFVLGGAERRVALLTASRTEEHLECGVHGLEILKTAHSAFSDYLLDEWTTLPPTRDRLFGTVMDVDWIYKDNISDFNGEHESCPRGAVKNFC